ncbi:MAG: aldo/keto reductase [Planctomycetes bacterium]|nr:aldo/keto reductase [Planctomycetota bacterium]
MNPEEQNQFTRRDFLVTTGAALSLSAGAALAGEQPTAKDKPTLPTRILGKTGVEVPILGIGTAQVGHNRPDKEAVQHYHECLDRGAFYLDAATTYGRAQLQLGPVLKDRRKEAFLVTKCFHPRGDNALKILKQNLKDLQTDYADLVYAHAIGDDKMDLETVLGPNGVMRALEKAKRDGLTRFIGITGHHRPARSLKVIKEFDIDVMMNAVNFADRWTYGFERDVWPEAASRNIGLVAMKVFGGEFHQKPPKGKGSRMPDEHRAMAFRYALSLPNVSLAVIGTYDSQELLANLEMAQNFKPLSSEEMTRLETIGRALADEWKAHLGPVA